MFVEAFLVLSALVFFYLQSAQVSAARSTNTTPLHYVWDCSWGYLSSTSVWDLSTYFGQLTYGIYKNLTLINTTVFLIKCLTTWICLYKFIKSILQSSRTRLQKKQTELQEIELQVEIVNAKLSLRETEFTERLEQLRVEVDKLSLLRMRVRDVIANDETLTRTLDEAVRLFAHDKSINHTSVEAEHKSIQELLKNVKLHQLFISDYHNESLQNQVNFESLEDSNNQDYLDNETSRYSSLSDSEIGNECRVKIVKITNVYKVAYLKHYIKQKRLRRANNHALLKKKMENIKKLLEDWQKTLNMAINIKPSTLNDSQADLLSQEAMGDYYKPTRDFSDDGSEKNIRDLYYDDFGVNWGQNSYRNFSDPYESAAETNNASEEYESTKYEEMGDSYQRHGGQARSRYELNGLFMLPEETSSQIAIEEIKYDVECGDLITLE